MLNLYIKKPEEVFDLEGFIESRKGELRAWVNNYIKDNFVICNDNDLSFLALQFIREKTDLEGYKHNDPIILQYVELVSMQELKDMFRQEIEYWVIRNNMNVSMIKTEDDYFKISIGNKAGYARFDTFREAEKFLRETYIPVERVNISDSLFKDEPNLIVVYKIK